MWSYSQTPSVVVLLYSLLAPARGRSELRERGLKSCCLLPSFIGFKTCKTLINSLVKKETDKDKKIKGGDKVVVRWPELRVATAGGTWRRLFGRCPGIGGGCFGVLDSSGVVGIGLVLCRRLWGCGVGGGVSGGREGRGGGMVYVGEGGWCEWTGALLWRLKVGAIVRRRAGAAHGGAVQWGRHWRG